MIRRALSIVGCALLLVAIARPAAAQISCVSDLPFELEECGIRRGANEPPAHCGSMHRGGTGGSGWSERQVATAKPEAEARGCSALERRRADDLGPGQGRARITMTTFLCTILIVLVCVPFLIVGMAHIRAINRASDALCRRMADELIAETRNRKGDPHA